MPWNIQRGAAGCSGYAVVNKEGKLVGCHDSETKAKAQMRALYASEADAKKVNKSILRGDKNG